MQAVWRGEQQRIARSHEERLHWCLEHFGEGHVRAAQYDEDALRIEHRMAEVEAQRRAHDRYQQAMSRLEDERAAAEHARTARILALQLARHAEHQRTTELLASGHRAEQRTELPGTSGSRGEPRVVTVRPSGERTIDYYASTTYHRTLV